MQLLGYDSRKNLVKTRLSARDIVALGIDPWRIDLLDDNPLTATVTRAGNRPFLRTRELSFSRLRPLSFAYRLRDENSGHIACFDGESGVCFTGEHHRSAEHFSITAPSPCAHGFVSCFRAYLEHLEQEETSLGGPGGVDFEAQGVSGGNNIILSAGRIGFIHGYSLDRRLGRYAIEETALRRMSFTGRMYEPVTVATRLDPAVNLVFDAFAQWQPVVFGSAISDSLRGRRIRDVAIIAQKPPAEGMPARAEALGFRWLDCHNGEQRYHGIEGYPPVRSCVLNGVTYFLTDIGWNNPQQMWQYEDLSNFQMFATKANEVTASRIALFDFSKKQTRVCASKHSSVTLMNLRGAVWLGVRAEMARKSGFKLVKGSFPLR